MIQLGICGKEGTMASKEVTEAKAAADKNGWLAWLAWYGPDKFYDAFLANAQGALSECVYCHQEIGRAHV